MPLQIVLNFIIAVLWMFLSETYHFVSFFTGFIIGAFLLFLLRRFIPDVFYLKRVWKILKLIFLFSKELIGSNIDIVKWVYKPKQTYKPGIFALPTVLTSNWEITLLTSLISLTPGTLSVAISQNNDYIYIHSMHIEDKDIAIKEIQDTFEKAIMEVTR